MNIDISLFTHKIVTVLLWMEYKESKSPIEKLDISLSGEWMYYYPVLTV